ncbi:hypothetical protein V6Z11_A13G229100 [Gossypium hirsutum]
MGNGDKTQNQQTVTQALQVGLYIYWKQKSRAPKQKCLAM